MLSTNILKLLVAALSATTATQAFNVEGSLFSHDVRQFRRELGNRQADSTGSGNSPSSSTPSASEPSAAAAATSLPPAATPTTPASGNTGTTLTPTSSNPAATGSSSDQSTDPQITPTPQTPTIQTTIIVVTLSDGSVISSTSLTVSTPTASLSGGGSSGGSSGMSATTRNTIIGVVVGVGGAIILAVAGIFAWRIWGRRKNGEENDVLMGFKDTDAGMSGVGNVGVAPMSTTGASSTASPFQSTLEQYHTTTMPQRNVNTAANF